MFDNHEAVLGKLAATGRKEFSLDTIKAVMEEVWEEGADQHVRAMQEGHGTLPDYFSDPESVNLLAQLPPAPATEELER
jgi:hypothetical protein